VVWGPYKHTIQTLFNTQEAVEINQQILELKTKNQYLEEEISQIKGLAKLDQEAKDKLTLLINNLEFENSRLKEDLAFFEGFIPSNSKGAISLMRLQVNKDTVPGQYHFKALVLQGSQRPSVDLNVQLLIKVLNKEKSNVIVLPDTGSSKDPQFKIKLIRFSRISGIFSIPTGSELQSLEMRILEGRTIRAQSTIKL
jgi:hypothetical protein